MTATAVPGAPRPVQRRALSRPRRRPALDGLRALAVTAVVIYHIDDNVLPGGFVGVDLFFVLSGYLITTLLLQEHTRTGGVELRSFWSRRVRRLWPLGWLLIAAVGVAGLFDAWAPDQQRTLPAQSLAGLANVSNWWQMANGGYLEEFAEPSPLRHLWSLAVEEQMYVIWPLLLLGLLWLGRRAHRSAVGIGIGALSVASVAAAWWSTPERAYLATDSRAIGILVGAGLAVAWQVHPMAGPRSGGARRTIGAAGAVGGVGLLAACVLAEPMAPWLHRGGFLVVALAACAVVATALTNVRSRSLLDGAALVWVGERSYAIYLIHWPLAVAFRPVVPWWALWIIVIGGSVVLAEAVHRWIERPIIATALRPRLLAMGGVALLLVLGVSLRLGEPQGATAQEQLRSTLERVADPTTAPGPGSDDASRAPSTTTTTCVPAVVTAPVFGDGSAFDSRTVETVLDPASACSSQVKLLVLGDSTGRGISNGLNALGDQRVQVWDRTDLGCSFGPESCGEWRDKWGADVAAVRPDVVMVYATVQPDLYGVDDAPFLSEEADRQRVAAFTDAVTVAGSTGAKVVLVRPALPSGEFYCTARNRRTTCDPEELAAWDRSLQQVADATGASVLDVGDWVARNTRPTDRPDGLHLSGDALRSHAQWLVPQIVAVAGKG